MSDLTTLLSTDRRSGVVADLAQLAEEAVDKQSGISGMAIKGGLAAAKKVRPTIVPQGIDRLLPDILGDLDGRWKQYQDDAASDFGAFLEPNSEEVAESLLNTADDRLNEMNNQTITKIYNSVRGRGGKLLAPHIPEIGRIVEKHMN